MTILVASAIAVFLLLADQLTKYFVLRYLADGTVVTVIPKVVQFRYVENTGMAFSLLEGRSRLLGLFTFLVCAVLIGVLIWKRNSLSPSARMALLLVISGGIGNGIDRVTRHFVVDFIELLFVDFAVFNVADICVTVGALWLMVLFLLHSGEEGEQKKNG